MKPELIVIANAAHARLFLRDAADGLLRTLATLEHPDSRRKARDLTEDRLGHERTDQRPGGVSYTPRSDPRRKAHAQFAREVAGRIDGLLQEGLCHGVVLLASDPFLGELKAHFGEPARHALRKAVPLDLTALDLAELEQRLALVLAPA